MESRLLPLAWLSVIIVAGVGVWGWSVDPEHSSRWAFVVLFLPALWGFLELAQSGFRRSSRGGIMSFHRSVVAGAGLLLAVRLGSQLAISTGLLDADWESFARRLWGVLFGSLLAVWGNYLPKILSPWNLVDEPFDWQRVHRFAGWLASLCGVALVIVWLALSIDAAKLATLAITVTFVVLGVGRKFVSVAAYARRQPPSTPPTQAGTRDASSMP